MTTQWQVRLYRSEDAPVFVSLLVHERFSFSYSTSDLGGIVVTVPERPITINRFEKILRLFGATATNGSIADVLPSNHINLSQPINP